MQADCMAPVVLQPRRRTGDVRQMPFGAQLRGRDHPRSGADDMCARSGRLRVFEGARDRQICALDRRCGDHGGVACNEAAEPAGLICG